MILTWCALLAEGCLCFILGIYDLFNEKTLAALSSAIIFINVLVGFCDLLKQKENWKISLVMFGGFIFRIMLLFWDLNFSHIFRFPDSGLDTLTFQYAAQDVYDGLPAGRAGLYAQTIAYGIYTLFGPQPILGQYTNILLAMSSIIIVKNTLKKIEADEKSIFAVVLIMSFLPYYAMNNTLLLRETINQFLIAASLYFFVGWFKDGYVSKFIIAIVISLLSSAYHSGTIAVAAAYCICCVLYDRENKRFKFEAKTIVLIIVFIFAFMAINATMGDKLFGKFKNVESAEDITRVTESYNAGGASYDVGIETGNALLDMIVNTPLRMIYFVLSPVPWKWRGANDILAFMCSAALYGYAYIIAIKALKQKDFKNKNMIIVCIIIALMSAMIFAWGVSNAGAALRHRDKFICPYLILLGLSLNFKNDDGEVQG